MKRSTFITLSLLTIYSCKQQETTTISNAGPNFTKSSSIGRWPQTNSPINLKISSEFTNDFTNADLVNGLNPIEVAAKTWNDSIPNNQFFVVPFALTSSTGYVGLDSFYQAGDPEMGIYKSHNWFSNVSSNAIAITQYYGYVRSSSTLGSYVELTHADIIVNYRDFGSQFSLNASSVFDYDLPTVILHEMGHFLGLGHDVDHTSIMYPRYISTQRTLFNFDRTKINDLYLRNINSLTANTNSNAVTLPAGTLVRGRIELLNNGICKHYENDIFVSQHETQKKSPAINGAFSKIYSKFKKLF